MRLDATKTSLRVSFFARTPHPIVLRFYAPDGQRLVNFTIDRATGTLADIDVFIEDLSRSRLTTEAIASGSVYDVIADELALTLWGSSPLKEVTLRPSRDRSDRFPESFENWLMAGGSVTLKSTGMTIRATDQLLPLTFLNDSFRLTPLARWQVSHGRMHDKLLRCIEDSPSYRTRFKSARHRYGGPEHRARQERLLAAYERETSWKVKTALSWAV
jgi:hypothetical protein